LIIKEKPCPETAYMLVYISNEFEDEILEPIVVSNLPCWI